MKKQIERYIKLIEKGLSDVTIYISFFDNCVQTKQLLEEQEIREQILKCFKIKSIIFNQKNLNDQSITIQIANILKTSNQFQLRSDDCQILIWYNNNFNDEDENDDFSFDEILHQKKKIIFQNVKYFFAKDKNRLTQSLSKLQLDNPKQDYMDCLSRFREFTIKEAQVILDSRAQCLKYNEQFQIGEQQYRLYFHLLKESNISFKQLLNLILEKEKLYYQKLLKKCPYCHKIYWIQYGCSKVQCELGCKNYFLRQDNPNIEQLGQKIAIQCTYTEFEELLPRHQNSLRLFDNDDLMPKEVIQYLNHAEKELQISVKNLICNRKIIQKKSK